MSAAAEQARRDAALERLTRTSPYHRYIGVGFTRMGDELTARLAFSDHLIGNPAIPALHGGVTGALLEITAIMQLAWDDLWRRMEAGDDAAHEGRAERLPKTIDLTIDYLRSGRPRDTFARATVLKAGRRVANVRVEAWQDARSRPIAAAHGHFLMPESAGS